MKLNLKTILFGIVLSLSSFAVNAQASPPDERPVETAATDLFKQLSNSAHSIVSPIAFGKTFQSTGGDRTPIGTTIYPIQAWFCNNVVGSLGGSPNFMQTAYLYQDSFGNWKYETAITHFQ